MQKAWSPIGDAGWPLDETHQCNHWIFSLRIHWSSVFRKSPSVAIKSWQRFQRMLDRIDRPRSPFGSHRHSLALPEEEAAWSAAVFSCREGVKETSRDVSYAKRELTPRTGPLT